MLADYQGYLQRELGVSPATTVAYSSYLRPFLRSLALNCIDDIARITALDFIRYIEGHAGDGRPATDVAFCSRLRSFLRCLSAEGLGAKDLSAYVPLVKARGQVGLPAFSKAQVQQVLQGCGRATAKERRDYAVLPLLARLGLRANEVALLTLDDIDWRARQLHVQGKGRKRATMPLLPEVGEAIATYLRDGRPISGSRRVFLRSHAPHIGFTSSYAVIHIARSAINAANITGVAHRGSPVST
ncbi:tyrosine-type recombinase/integrase [Bradyrhizobium sp. Arg314]